MNGHSDDMAYPSRNIAYQAAGMITAIVESLEAHNELRFTPAFMYVPRVVRLIESRLTCFVVSIAYSLL